MYLLLLERYLVASWWGEEAVKRLPPFPHYNNKDSLDKHLLCFFRLLILRRDRREIFFWPNGALHLIWLHLYIVHQHPVSYFAFKSLPLLYCLVLSGGGSLRNFFDKFPFSCCWRRITAIPTTFNYDCEM